MTASNQPLVSLVTLVHNSERCLAECIESALNQNCRNWGYVLVNNSSTDQMQEIACQFAKMDERMRVHAKLIFLAIIDNWNHPPR